MNCFHGKWRQMNEVRKEGERERERKRVTI